MTAPPSHAETLHSLDALRWDRRVLLVYADDSARPAAIEALEVKAAAIDDRDVTWFVLDGDAVAQTNHDALIGPDFAASLRHRLGPIGRPLDVLLLGKDGGLKHRGPALELNGLFELIDGMPMRRREIESGDARGATGQR